jgi:hypothetical protein
MEMQYPLPPCCDMLDSSHFWTVTQAVVERAQNQSLITVKTIDGKIVSHVICFYEDGRIEVVIREK